MNFKPVEEQLIQLAETPGVIACALVATETGLIYSITTNNSQIEAMAESARDYWAIQYRNGGTFSKLGELTNIFVQHQKGILSLQPCGDNTLLVALIKLKHINWNKWPEIISPLKKSVAELELNS